MNILSIMIVILYILQAISLITVIFVENKNPISTVSWVLVLTFLPLIGFFFYIFFGIGLTGFSNKKLKAIQEVQNKIIELSPDSLIHYQATLDIINNRPYHFTDPVMNQYINLVKMNYHLCYTPYNQNNDLKIFIDAKDKYENLFEDIKNAKSSIHMVYFIISNSNISHQLVDLLAKKVKEGVEVRVIYDEIGNFVVPNKMFKKIIEAGGEVYKFFPLTFKTILHANYRNHHKIVVIDGKIGYTGGMNIGDEYMGLNPRKTPWRDTHMRLTGDIVKSLQSMFFIDLSYVKNNRKYVEQFITLKYFPKPIVTGNIGMQLVSSGPDDDKEAIKRILISMINSARKTLYIQTPYLMPDQPLMEALQNAAQSGVDVKLMLPGIADKQIPYKVTYSYMQNMLDYGVKIYLHKGFVHAKMLVIDDKLCTIGTTNLDMRSLSFHFEINNIIFDSKVSKQCGDIFRNDLTDCKEMTVKIYNQRGVVQRVLEKIFRLFAPLM